MVNDGGPAFPTVPVNHGYGPEESGHGTGAGAGMTLRDWFAGQALGAKLGAALIGYEDYAPDHRAELIRRVVRDCVEIADEMIRQLAEKAPHAT